uniref:Uncharacterized protein n=1 Tax=Oryza punctata TaxID=4537 RepID=A0A0E0L293_ORYPU
MEEDDDTVTVDGGGQQAVRTREEDEDISAAKGLLRASLPDAGNAFTNKEKVFTWAKSNNRRCSTSYICTLCSMWLAAEGRVELADNGGCLSSL